MQDNPPIISSATKTQDDHLPIVLPKPLATSLPPSDQQCKSQAEMKDYTSGNDIPPENTDQRKNVSDIIHQNNMPKQSLGNGEIEEYKDVLCNEMNRLSVNEVPRTLSTQKTSGLPKKIEKPHNPHEMSNTNGRGPLENQETNFLSARLEMEIGDTAVDSKQIDADLEKKNNENQTIVIHDVMVDENIFKPIDSSAPQVPNTASSLIEDHPLPHKNHRNLKRNENCRSPASPQSRKSEDSCYGNKGIVNYSCVEILYN